MTAPVVQSPLAMRWAAIGYDLTFQSISVNLWVYYRLTPEGRVGVHQKSISALGALYRSPFAGFGNIRPAYAADAMGLLY